MRSTQRIIHIDTFTRTDHQSLSVKTTIRSISTDDWTGVEGCHIMLQDLKDFLCFSCCGWLGFHLLCLNDP